MYFVWLIKNVNTYLCVLMHAYLVYQRFRFPVLDWSLYFPILGLVIDVKCSIIIPLSLYLIFLMKHLNTYVP